MRCGRGCCGSRFEGGSRNGIFASFINVQIKCVGNGGFARIPNQIAVKRYRYFVRFGFVDGHIIIKTQPETVPLVRLENDFFILIRFFDCHGFQIIIRRIAQHAFQGGDFHVDIIQFVIGQVESNRRLRFVFQLDHDLNLGIGSVDFFVVKAYIDAGVGDLGKNLSSCPKENGCQKKYSFHHDSLYPL